VAHCQAYDRLDGDANGRPCKVLCRAKYLSCLVELSAGEIAAYFDVTRPAVSQHLTVLKEEAGLVRGHLRAKRGWVNSSGRRAAAA
jgi:DNA-binding transcriptional ArsR family regulator